MHTNLNTLAHRIGFEFSHDLVMPVGHTDYRSCMKQAFGLDATLGVTCQLATTPSDHPIVSGVETVAFQSACTVMHPSDIAASVGTAEDVCTMRAVGPKGKGGSILQIQEYVVERKGPATFMAAQLYGNGRVVAIGSWKMFLNELVEDPMLDNARLFGNIVEWLGWFR